MALCSHKKVTCINQYELIRKYKCADCNEIMMCACDKEHGQNFLSHQLNNASCEGSKVKIPVTLGFQENICPECRGGEAVPAPKAPMHGATTKITRYYWREIAFETTKRFYASHPELNPLDHNSSEFNFPEERGEIRKKVISEIKEKHEVNPKYVYTEKTQKEVIESTQTKIGTYRHSR